MQFLCNVKQARALQPYLYAERYNFVSYVAICGLLSNFTLDKIDARRDKSSVKCDCQFRLFMNM